MRYDVYDFLQIIQLALKLGYHYDYRSGWYINTKDNNRKVSPPDVAKVLYGHGQAHKKEWLNEPIIIKNYLKRINLFK